MPAQGKADDIQRTFAHKFRGRHRCREKETSASKSHFLGHRISHCKRSWINFMGIFIFFYQKESYMIWGAAEGNLLILYLWSLYAGNLTPVPAPHLVESVNLHQ